MNRMPPPADLLLLSREEWSSATMPASGNVTLTLDPYPGSIGGHVGGVIGVPRELSAAREFAVELLCTRVRLQHANNTASWQDIGTFIGRPRADGGMDVPFCFDVPAHVPYSETPPGREREYHDWTLRISSQSTSGDFERRWRIPVLACGQRASAPVMAARAIVRAADTDAQLHLTQGSAGLTMDYPRGRWGGNAFYLLLAGAVFCGAAWFLAHKSALFLSIVCWLAGLVISASALWLIGNRLHVELSNGSFLITRQLFGVTVRHVAVALSQVAGITCKKTGSSTRGAEIRVYYWLMVRTLDGASHIIGDGFVGYGQAMAGARRLAELTGLQVLEQQ